MCAACEELISARRSTDAVVKAFWRVLPAVDRHYSCGSFVGGWRELANGHPARGIDPAVVLVGSDSISLNGRWAPFTYHRAVRVSADDSGVTVVQSLPFRSFAPTMHLRWSDLLSCTERHWPTRTDAVLRIRDSDVEISIHDGEELLRQCRKNPAHVTPQAKSSLPAHVNNERRPEEMNVGGDVTAPTVVRRHEPAYDACRLGRIRVSGPLVAQAIIDATGNVQEVRIVKPIHPCLDRAFQESLVTWKFLPAQRHGLPVSVRMHFTANVNVR